MKNKKAKSYTCIVGIEKTKLLNKIGAIRLNKENGYKKHKQRDEHINNQINNYNNKMYINDNNNN